MHLAVEALSTAEFILAFVKFVSYYGVFSAVCSNSARSFVQVVDIMNNYSLVQIWEKVLYSVYYTSYESFYAAWYGLPGNDWLKFWRQLYKTLGRNTPSLFDFVTFLSQIQKLMNSRLLTYSSSGNEK